MKPITYITIIPAMLLLTALLAACTAQEESSAPANAVGQPIEFTIAPPPVYTGGNVDTRTAIDKAGDMPGKVTWTPGDIIYTNLKIFDENQVAIKTYNFALTYRDPEGGTNYRWVAPRNVVWPIDGDMADISGNYIGASTPSIALENQEIYTVHANNIPAGRSIALNDFSIKGNIYEFTNLEPGDVVTIESEEIKHYIISDQDYGILTSNTSTSLTETVGEGESSTIFIATLSEQHNATISVLRAGILIANKKKIGLPNISADDSKKSGLYYITKFFFPKGGDITPDKFTDNIRATKPSPIPAPSPQSIA